MSESISNIYVFIFRSSNVDRKSPTNNNNYYYYIPYYDLGNPGEYLGDPGGRQGEVPWAVFGAAGMAGRILGTDWKLFGDPWKWLGGP